MFFGYSYNDKIICLLNNEWLSKYVILDIYFILSILYHKKINVIFFMINCLETGIIYQLRYAFIKRTFLLLHKKNFVNPLTETVIAQSVQILNVEITFALYHTKYLSLELLVMVYFKNYEFWYSTQFWRFMWYL